MTGFTSKVATLTGISVAAAGLVMVTAPTAHAADKWKTTKSSTSCFTYSYGRVCTTKTTKLRQVPYCTKPSIKNPYASMAWATYCARYSETSKWV